MFCFQIQETPDRHNSKFIEFYDVRAAEMALRAMDKTNAGKQIKLEAGYPGGAKQRYRVYMQLPLDKL